MPLTTPRRHPAAVKLSRDEWELLETTAERLDLSRSQVLRRGLRLVVEQLAGEQRGGDTCGSRMTASG